MDEQFKIYVDQLRKGGTETIEETLSSDFLEQRDEELSFDRDVEINGEAYIADQELVLHLRIETQATIPCAICNTPVEIEVKLDNFYHAEPLEAVKSGIFNYKEVLREAIIIEAPLFAECTGGTCPMRKDYDRFLRKETASVETNEEEGYQPFKDL